MLRARGPPVRDEGVEKRKKCGRKSCGVLQSRLNVCCCSIAGPMQHAVPLHNASGACLNLCITGRHFSKHIDSLRTTDTWPLYTTIFKKTQVVKDTDKYINT